jgi:UrcA family protein
MKTLKSNSSSLQQFAAAAAAVAAVIALSALTGAAFAADASGAAAPGAADTDVPSVVVRFDAHSLDTERGTREVYRRIVSAARSVCPDDDNTRDLQRLSVAQQCQKAAVARAVALVHHQRLAEIAAAQDKRL